jgi:hypothetical protein
MANLGLVGSGQWAVVLALAESVVLAEKAGVARETAASSSPAVTQGNP